MEKKDKKDAKKTVAIRYRFPTIKEPRPTQLLFRAVSILPDEAKAYFHNNPVILSGETKEHPADAVRFTEESKECKYIIHFHERLWNHTDQEIIAFILIQLAHCFLDHNSELWSWNASKEFISKSEADAEALATQWYQNCLDKDTPQTIYYKVLHYNKADIEQNFPDAYR